MSSAESPSDVVMKDSREYDDFCEFDLVVKKVKKKFYGRVPLECSCEFHRFSLVFTVMR